MEAKDFTDVVEEKKEFLDQSFRDSVSTISKQGNPNYIFPKKPRGKFYNLRTIASLIYLIIFFTLPFVKINGEPLFLFNVVQRKFIFFGQIFWPQDFFIFAIGFLTFMVFIIFFTVVFGRVFCGWACPQTIFMEMVFRRIEYWLDGDASEQRKLKDMSWNPYKIRKRATKMAVFYFISFIIANFFLAYVIGMDDVLAMVKQGIGANPVTFVSLLVFSAVFFFVYYWFREQVCIVVCPYGRLQGVLLDKKSIVVAYDYVRGEPRGKIKKSDDSFTDTGDCIDCAACVRVCPTGIDIRNGTQLECVNCTACIDACNDIMDKIGRARGLIRYESEENIAHSKKTKFNWRIAAYSLVLLLLTSALVVMLITRNEVDARVVRTAGQMFQTLPDGRIGNLYNIKLVNKTRKEIPVLMKLENMKGDIEVVQKNMIVPSESYFQTSFFVKIDRQLIEKRKTAIVLGVYQGDKRIETIKTTFLGPGL
ncbi:MAG TPA: cytochrome c oxidase accessory protein CcoG [Chitinophagaceae bacterium]|nr:cytochrome c oxidase accessory protein CcoG [Chitinophagaceae bacterium]